MAKVVDTDGGVFILYDHPPMAVQIPGRLSTAMLAALKDAAKGPLVYSVAGWKHEDALQGYSTQTIDALAGRGLMQVDDRTKPRKAQRWIITSEGRQSANG